MAHLVKLPLLSDMAGEFERALQAKRNITHMVEQTTGAPSFSFPSLSSSIPNLPSVNASITRPSAPAQESQSPITKSKVCCVSIIAMHSFSPSRT
jgi:hypothetical protein